MKFRKLAVAILFTAALMIPTTFGIPLTFTTFSSVGVQEAEARTGQWGTQLRQVRISHGRMFWFETGTRATGRATTVTTSRLPNHIVLPPNRSSVRVTAVRDTNSNRAQVRFRINNGSWTSWSRSNASRSVSVPANNGTSNRSVRLRIQVRSENGRNTQTYHYVIRRASTNTRADRLTVTGGTLTPAFNPNTTSYRVNLPWGTPAAAMQVSLRLRAAHPAANVSYDRLTSSFHFGFLSHPASNRWQIRRTMDTNSFNVRFGETVRVRFRIMGAYNTMTSGANRTRIYTVNVHRGPTTYQEIVNRFLPAVNGATSAANLSAAVNDARAHLNEFRWSQTGDQALIQTMNAHLNQIHNAANQRAIAMGWPNRW